MDNRDIRPEWVPSAYKEDLNADKKIDAKASPVKPTTSISKGIYTGNGFKRRRVK